MKKESSLSSLKRLWPYLYRYRKRMIVGMICVMASSRMAIVPPQVVGVTIDALQAGKLQHTLLYYAGVILLATFFQAAFLFLMRRIMIGVSRDIEYDLRNDLYQHMQVLSQSYYNRMFTGDLMSRNNNDLSAVRMVLGPAIMYSTNTFFTAIFTLTRMGMLNYKLMFLSLLPLPFVSWLVTRYGEVIHNRFKDVQAQFSNISNRVLGSSSGSVES